MIFNQVSYLRIANVEKIETTTGMAETLLSDNCEWMTEVNDS